METLGDRRQNAQEESKIDAFRKNLPIYEHKDTILKTILENDFCIITGDTGSGKSTQLPQYILDSPEVLEKLKKFSEGKYDRFHMVVTQPRRVAAIAMANRVCYERGATLSQDIGYTIRFDDKSSEKTILRYVTDGVLVRECLSDHELSRYNVVILDEAHERSLYTDILFALVKKAVFARKGSLKLIITSATLDTLQFSTYFNNSPVVKMSGRCFPVQIKFGTSAGSRRVDEAVDAAIRMHLHEGPGDILVFLTGSEECEQARKQCYRKLEKLIAQGREVPSMLIYTCLLYTSPSPRDRQKSRMPSSA
eukprot:TRINITY_DN8198_c0_g1_i7.p1 TRINITY_DN8198_c0_g1~~TRINITY_DN8198_c0_g1_i7.p1  ORF type:complete len:308 (-),score=65.03 TRINITY_DN8198_c0_g1_i7:10-933(-)